MRKTKITAIIMLIIASMLTSIIPVGAASIDSLNKIAELGFGNDPTSEGVDYRPYIYGTTYGEADYSTAANGMYGRRMRTRGYATLNFTEIAEGYDFAAYGIKFEDGKEIDISAYENAGVSFGINSNTDSTVLKDDLYFAIMTKGNDCINFAGAPVEDLTSGTKGVAISDFEFLGSTGSETSIDLSKVCGLGLIRMNYTGEGDEPASSGKIYLDKLEINTIDAIDDLEAAVVDNKPVLSFTEPAMSDITYTVIVEKDGEFEREIDITDDLVTENGKYTWTDEDTDVDSIYTYKIKIEKDGCSSVSNGASALIVATIPSEPVPEGGSDPMVVEAPVRTYSWSSSKENEWADKVIGANKDATLSSNGSGDKLGASKTLQLTMNYDNLIKESADENVGTFFAAGYMTDIGTKKGGDNGTTHSGINISNVEKTGTVFFRLYIDETVDLENAYFSIGQRWLKGVDKDDELTYNFAGVPMKNYVKEEDKGKVVTVSIPLTEFMGNKAFRKGWYHYKYQGSQPTAKKDVDLRYFGFMGLLRDCSKGTSDSSGSIYISDMAVYNIAPATNARVYDSSKKAIYLKWNHSTSDISGYNIYREYNGKKVLIGTSDNNTFVDTNGAEPFAENTPYKYYIAARNEIGAESTMAGVTVEVKKIGAPRNFMAENDYSGKRDCKVEISWDAQSYGNAVKYELYRNDVLYQTIDKDDTTYVDENVNHGAEYKYYIMAIDEDGNKSNKSEVATIIASSISPIENFIHQNDDNDDVIDFAWDAVTVEGEQEITYVIDVKVNGVVVVDGYTTNDTAYTGCDVDYNKEIAVSIKAISSLGGESCLYEYPLFAIYGPEETFDDNDWRFKDELKSNSSLEGRNGAAIQIVKDKSIFGSKSLHLDFTNSSANILTACIMGDAWNVQQHRYRNGELSFWIYAEEDVDYGNIDVALQNDEIIEEVNHPLTVAVDLEKYITEKGKWVYVKIPFMDFPEIGVQKFSTYQKEKAFNFVEVDSLAFMYDARYVYQGQDFYVDHIGVVTNDLWSAAITYDGGTSPVGEIISADAKTIEINFVEDMDATTLTTDSIWIVENTADASGKVVNCYITYDANNKVCTINLMERLEKNKSYALCCYALRSAAGIVASGQYDFTSGNEDYTGELNQQTAIEPVITSANAGSTVTVTVSMPTVPVYRACDYNLTITYDKTKINPNGTTAVTVKALSGATVSYGDGVITLSGNSDGNLIQGALAEIVFSVSATANTDVTVAGSIDILNSRAGVTFPQAVAKTETLSVNTGGGVTGGLTGAGGGGGGGTAGREDATIKGNEAVDPTEGESVQQGTTTGTFTDINSVSWAADAITALIEEGVMSGYPDNTVKPEKTITREEFASLLVRAFSFKSELTESPFADVANDAWYANAIIVAHEKGIVSGVNESDFGIGNTITREDMCTMIYRAMQASRMSPESVYDGYQFADGEQISQYAQEAISALYKSGVISGVSDTEFAPKAEVNRAMAARVLYGVMGMM